MSGKKFSFNESEKSSTFGTCNLSDVCLIMWDTTKEICVNCSVLNFVLDIVFSCGLTGIVHSCLGSLVLLKCFLKFFSLLASTPANTHSLNSKMCVWQGCTVTLFIGLCVCVCVYWIAPGLSVRILTFEILFWSVKEWKPPFFLRFLLFAYYQPDNTEESGQKQVENRFALWFHELHAFECV